MGKNRITYRTNFSPCPVSMPLTDTKIRNAKPHEKPYSLQDGQGLYLDVRPTGAKIWRYRFWLSPKKDGRYTIGEYPGVSLADARREREWAREQVRQGKNPTIVKDTEKLMVMGDAANTFKSIAEEWYERKCQTWAEKTQIVNRGFLDKHILPAIGKIPVKDVKAAHILALMRKLEKAGNAYSAGKVRQICSAVFCYAVATLRAEVDPSYALRGAVMQKPTTHARPATTEELRQLFVSLRNYKSPVMVICIKMLVMTFVRQQELRFARWDDINLEKAEWIIPKEVMKKRREHRVPLCDHVIALLEELKPLTGDKEYLFPSPSKPGQPIAKTTINRAIEYQGFASGEITGHDFRATASTALYEQGFRPEVIEAQLAHQQKNRVAAAYNHAEYMKERREMMDWWGGVIAGLIEDKK
ncbi:tyrosine-type recombinase/integrase [Cronobacter sakazakii]|nr:tyrosine-type recombinase/integrase [Cronobacter sakazakii]EKK3977754.1 tyrosine-type recombinase/integrase [Cronobacter sakazakii]ELY2791066.1 tyrosine-type recombinase/integrase [Cronobacter sakazakii]ELY3569502.1 tyrosine-type recombinase/integrase [Cronobacter sakazakii]ELY3975743.1 tyrosine-type recombinase/integrase [Cronobacter sakazakii]